MAKYDINIRDYWRIIRKRRTIVIMAITCFTLVSLLSSLIFTPAPVYKATSAVKVDRTTNLLSLLVAELSWTTWDNVASQAVIVNSFPIMEASARQMGLIPEAVSSEEVLAAEEYLRIVTGLKARITAEQEGRTNIINISATSESPAGAALLSNTVAKVFRQANVEERNKKVRETREFIEQRLEVVENRLKQAEENLSDFEKNTKLLAIDAQTQSALDRLTRLENEIAQLKQRRYETTKQLSLLQQIMEGVQGSEKAFYVEDPPPQLTKLTARYRDLSLQRKVLLTDYTDEHPAVMTVGAEIQNVLTEMGHELRSMLDTMDTRLNGLQTRLAELQAQTMTIPESALVLARLRREVEVNAELHAQLQSKYQEVMIQESGLIEEVHIVKPALEPSQPAKKRNTGINTLVGAVIGLALGLVLALVVESMDTSLGTIEDVEELLRLPVLGVIPATDQVISEEKGDEEGKRHSQALVTHFAPHSLVAEAYRSLRTNIQFIHREKKVKVFLISSSSLQEGKTYNVVNLSLSLAQAGEKVLLIDADLRRPMVHRIFGLDRQPGLTEYIMGEYDWRHPGAGGGDHGVGEWTEFRLVQKGWQPVVNTIASMMLGELDIEDILRTPGLDNLHIINAGTTPLNPSEILRSQRFKDLLRRVRDTYDIIIVDTPPVLPVADAFEVASEVDGVVLVYEVGRIGRAILNRAKIQLENMKANVLGVILNNIKPEVAPDLYRYSTKYCYGEEDSEEAHPPTPQGWWGALGQSIRNVVEKMLRPRAALGKRLSLILFISVGCALLALALLWQNYSHPTSGSQNLSNPTSKGSSFISEGKQRGNVSSPAGKRERLRKIRASVPLATLRLPEKPEVAAEKAAPIAEAASSQVGMTTETTIAPKDYSSQPFVGRESFTAGEPVTSELEVVQRHTTRVLLARIRSRPDINAPTLQIIPRGTELKVVGKHGNWLKLKLRNRDMGWIYHTLVRKADYQLWSANLTDSHNLE